MTLDEIKALSGVSVDEQEKMIVVRALEGYALRVVTETATTENGEDAAAEAEPTEESTTDSVFMPVGATDYPTIEVVECVSASTDDGGVATLDEGIAVGEMTTEEKLAELYERVARLESLLQGDAAASEDESGIMLY